MSRKKRSKSNVWCVKRFIATLEQMNHKEDNVALMSRKIRKGIVRYMHFNPNSDLSSELLYLMVYHKTRIITSEL